MALLSIPFVSFSERPMKKIYTVEHIFRIITPHSILLILTILAFFASCSNPPVVSISLLDHSPDSTFIVPWEILSFEDIEKRIAKFGEGIERNDRLIRQIGKQSKTPIPITVSDGNHIGLGIGFKRPPSGPGMIVARLYLDGQFVAADSSGFRNRTVALDLPGLGPGEYILELIIKATPGSAISHGRMIISTLSSEKISVDTISRMKQFLRWLSLAGLDAGRPYPSDRRVTLSMKNHTKSCFYLFADDSFEFNNLPEPGNHELRFSYSVLSGGDRKPLILAVRTSEDGETWHTVKQIELSPRRHWHDVSIAPESSGSWQDHIKFETMGENALIAVSDPVLVPYSGKSSKPNVIIIDLDTARADRFGVYGYTKRPTSARLDSMIKEKGFVVFEKAYAPSSWTLSSTSKFLSSRYIHRNLRPDYLISSRTPMLAEIMRQFGYYCAGYTAGGLLCTAGFDRGFHDYYWGTGNGGIETSFPQATRWLRETREPFFLFLHTYEPHQPYFRSIFTRDLPRGRLGDVGRGEDLLPRRLSLESHFTEIEKEYIHAVYDGGIRVSADAVADLFEFMDSRSLWDNTIVIILSDHGEEFWEHFRIFGKHCHTMYEELLHVPFLVYSPDMASYKRVQSRVSLVDMVPTVLELAGLEWSGATDGVSLVPLLKRPSSRRNEPVIANIDHPIQGKGYCIVQDDRKYIEFQYKEFSKLRLDKVSPLNIAGQELYFLDEDPHERNNVSADSLTLVSLQAKLYDTIRNTADPIVSQPKQYSHTIRGDLENQLRALGYIE